MGLNMTNPFMVVAYRTHFLYGVSTWQIPSGLYLLVVAYSILLVFLLPFQMTTNCLIHHQHLSVVLALKSLEVIFFISYYPT